MKKILLIALIILVVGGLVWAGYIFSRRIGPSQPAAGNEQNAFQNLPTGGGASLDLSAGGGLPIGGGVLSLLSNSPAAGYAPTGGTSAILVKTDGTIIAAGGQTSSTLSGSEIQDLREVKFSADGKKIAVAFGSVTPQLSVFDVEAKTWRPIADGGGVFAWSPSGETLAYLAPESATLFTLDMSNPKAKTQNVFKLRVEDVRLAWAGKYIWLYDRPSALTNGSLWRIDPAKKTMQPVIQDQLGLDIAWGESQALVFGSNLGGRGGRLSLMDFDGNFIQQMRVLTLPDKCAFHQETVVASSTGSSSSKPAAVETLNYLFCAIPRDAQGISAAALPDDYYQRDLITKDGIYKIDLASGVLAPAWTEDAPSVDATDIKISGGNLYFLNRWNEGVYKLKL